MKTTMTKIMERLEHACPEVAQRFSQSFVPKTQTPREQQAEINCYLRRELGSLEINTHREREYLIDARPVGLWLRDLERHVFPTLVRNGI